MSERRDDGRLSRFRYEYGAQHLHLIAVVSSFGLAGYAFLRIFENPSTGGVLLWLGLAAILHDIVALPLYLTLSHIADLGTRRVMHPRLATLALNHIRVPAALSLLLLIVSFPLVFGVDEPYVEATTGLGTDRYLGNWLLIAAVLFLVSGIAYALRMRGHDPVPEEAPDRRNPPGSPPLALRLAARGVLAAGALVAFLFAALAIYGFVSAFPL